MENTEDLKERLRRLIKEKACHEGEIKLASGKTSRYYIDARAVTLSSAGAYLVGRLLFDVLKDAGIRAAGGPTLGADPMVGALAAVSFEKKWPIDTFLIRKTPKTHGRMLRVEGPSLEPGCEVVLLDDVATTGGSLLDGLAVLRQMDVVVRRAIVLIDREEGATANLAAQHCELTSLFKLSDFFSCRP